MSIFANKTLMITGGTGSFGNAVLNRILRLLTSIVKSTKTKIANSKINH